VSDDPIYDEMVVERRMRALRRDLYMILGYWPW